MMPPDFCIVDHALVQELHPLRRLVRHVRRQHHLLARQNGMVRRQGLHIVDVEGRPRQMPD